MGDSADDGDKSGSQNPELFGLNGDRKIRTCKQVPKEEGHEERIFGETEHEAESDRAGFPHMPACHGGHGGEIWEYSCDGECTPYIKSRHRWWWSMPTRRNRSRQG